MHRPSAPVQSLVAGTVAASLAADRGYVATGVTRGWIHWEDTGVHARVRDASRKGASPTERRLARVWREAGARVKFNAYLRDMKLSVPGNDERRIEVLGTGFALL